MLSKERWIKNRMLELIETIKNQLKDKDNVFSATYLEELNELALLLEEGNTFDDVHEKHLKIQTQLEVCSKLLYNKKGQWFCECSKCGFDNPIGIGWHKE